MPEFLNAKQYMDVMSLVNVNHGGSPIDWAGILEPTFYQSIMDGKFTGTNWLDAIRNENAPYQNHSVNIVGGTEMTKYSFGISNTDQEGIFGYPVQSKYSRTTVRMNSDHVILRKGDLDVITFGQNMTYTYNTKSGIGIGNHYWNDIFNMLVANPILPMYNEAGEYTDYDETEATGLWALDPYVANPVVAMVKSGRGNNQSQNHALNLSANLRIQPIKDLVFRSQVNYRMSASTYRDYSMVYKTSNYAFSDTDTVSQSASAGWNWSWENTLNYKFNIAQKNHFDVLAGSTLEHSGFGESVNAARSGGAWPNDYLHAYVSNMIGNVDASSIGGSTWGDSGLASFFGRINYDYDEKYMLSAIVRADGSSNFARGHRWGIFPSVAAGWVVSSEPWMEGTKSVLDYLKLRASWGQNGNCNVDNFQYLATVAIGPDNGGYAFGHGALENWQTGSYADKLANADISWETSEQIDLGFDARFFNNRLKLDATAYASQTYHQFFEPSLPTSSSFASVILNAGRVDNMGVELSASWTQEFASGFNWRTYMTYSHNKNIIREVLTEWYDSETDTVLSLPSFEKGGMGGVKTILKEGGSMSDIYVTSLKTDEHGAIYVHPSNQTVTADYKYIYAGDTAPKHLLSWGNEFSYKGFNLNFLFNARIGGVAVSKTQAVMDFYGISQDTADARDNGGALVNGKLIPAINYYQVVGAGDGVLSQYVYDATNIRLAELSLGYNFPVQNWCKWLKGLNVSFVGHNLAMLLLRAPFDPEMTATTGTYNQGIDYFMQPSTRNLGFSVKLKF